MVRGTDVGDVSLKFVRDVHAAVKEEPGGMALFCLRRFWVGNLVE